MERINDGFSDIERQEDNMMERGRGTTRPTFRTGKEEPLFRLRDTRQSEYRPSSTFAGTYLIGSIQQSRELGYLQRQQLLLQQVHRDC